MLQLILPDMTCGHCVKTVTETIHRLDPAAAVEIDLESHIVRIKSAQPPEDIRKVLAHEGYPAA
jgi:copper chaperone